MALIVLEPGEVFAHRHDEDSYSKLVAGAARLECGGRSTELEPDIPVATPGRALHRLVAASPSGATVECKHVDTPPPDRV
jgi:mannose-6-phosphate isomerase-like protein (cupin superfamily)